MEHSTVSVKYGNGDAPKYTGSRRRETPCERCGWEYEGFHICFDKGKKVEGEGKLPAKARHRNGNPGPKSEAAIENMRDAANRRWEAQRRLNAPRDAEIVQKYKEGASYATLAAEYDVSNDTIVRIMHRARDEGKVTIRARRGGKKKQSN